jgi:hypothetical protein
MKRDDASPDPSPESLAEIPEVDFSTAIRPNRYANLRGEFEHAVFLDRELFARFGSAEKVVEALRLLADLGEKSRSRGAA